MNLPRTLLAGTASLVVLFPSLALADPAFPPHQGRPVIDAANIIPAPEEAALNARLLEYERTTGHQLAVATVPSLEDYAVEDYANRYFRFLQLGDRDVDDGTLFLFAPTEKQMRIEVGYGLEPVLTDAAAKLIIENDIKPHMNSSHPERYHIGIAAGATAIMAATQMDQAAIDELRAKKAAADKARSDRFWAGVGDFFMTVLGFGAVIGFFWFLMHLFFFGPRRRKREAEQRERDRLAAIEREKQYAENQRLRAVREKRDRIAREKQRAREHQRQEEANRERQHMLAAMTPAALAAFLAREEQQRQEAARVAAEAAELRAEQDRKRRERDDEDRARRRREDDDRRRRDSYSSSSSFGSGSSSSSWSGGGGSSGGGGASGNWD